LELEVEPSVVRIQFCDRLERREGSTHGPLGIVFVNPRGAEDRNDRVPDEPLNRSAVSLELRAQPFVVRDKPRSDVLWIDGVGCHRPDDVDEDYGDDLPLRRQALTRPESRTARGTEPCGLGSALAASWASKHAASLPPPAGVFKT
jgi:hypothetical protein